LPHTAHTPPRIVELMRQTQGRGFLKWTAYPDGSEHELAGPAALAEFAAWELSTRRHARSEARNELLRASAPDHAALLAEFADALGVTGGTRDREAVIAAAAQQVKRLRKTRKKARVMRDALTDVRKAVGRLGANASPAEVAARVQEVAKEHSAAKVTIDRLTRELNAARTTNTRRRLLGAPASWAHGGPITPPAPVVQVQPTSVDTVLYEVASALGMSGEVNRDTVLARAKQVKDAQHTIDLWAGTSTQAAVNQVADALGLDHGLLPDVVAGAAGEALRRADDAQQLLARLGLDKPLPTVRKVANPLEYVIRDDEMLVQTVFQPRPGEGTAREQARRNVRAGAALMLHLAAQEDAQRDEEATRNAALNQALREAMLPVTPELRDALRKAATSLQGAGAAL
jgi:hypothetical protein